MFWCIAFTKTEPYTLHTPVQVYDLKRDEHAPDRDQVCAKLTEKGWTHAEHMTAATVLLNSGEYEYMYFVKDKS